MHKPLQLTLPWPPSANHYYRRVGPRTLISREGREYRKSICGLLAPVTGGIHQPLFDGRVCLCIDAFPPDRRRRDIDNLQKCLIDSIEHAGVYQDDGQIDLLLTGRRAVALGGRVNVRVEELPLSRCPLCGHRPTQNHESEYFHVK